LSCGSYIVSGPLIMTGATPALRLAWRGMFRQ
jgi:hypothetical protein